MPVRDVVARELNVMGQMQAAGTVIECASHVTLGVNVKVFVGIPITSELQDETDDSASDDEEQGLPLVTRSADTVEVTIVTKMLISPNYVNTTCTSQMIKVHQPDIRCDAEGFNSCKYLS